MSSWDAIKKKLEAEKSKIIEVAKNIKGNEERKPLSTIQNSSKPFPPAAVISQDSNIVGSLRRNSTTGLLEMQPSSQQTYRSFCAAPLKEFGGGTPIVSLKEAGKPSTITLIKPAASTWRKTQQIPRIPQNSTSRATNSSVPMSTYQSTSNSIPSPYPAATSNLPSADFSSDFLENINARIFKNKTFLPKQKESIIAMLSNRDVLTILPTGGGKSLIYQLAAIAKWQMQKCITVVVMPLLSLIQDQSESLRRILSSLDEDDTVQTVQTVQNFKIAVATGNQTSSHIAADLAELLENGGILFTTPEKLTENDQMKEFIVHASAKLGFFVFDEAHCVSQWGHDFRAAYLTVGRELRSVFSHVPILALTATASPTIKDDVINQLQLVNVVCFSSSIDRPNLKLSAKPHSKHALPQIMLLLKGEYKNKSVIVYCGSRKVCDTIAKYFVKQGVKAAAYHAGMTAKKREAVQKNWMNEKTFVVVATIAFGMGIDNARVRLVVHLATPSSMEGFYQEIGRAGRDGLPAECILFHSWKDKILNSARINDPDGGNNFRKGKRSYQRSSAPVRGSNAVHSANQTESLNNMVGYCEDIFECRRVLIGRHFKETLAPCKTYLCQVCDNCERNRSFILKNFSTEASQITGLLRSIQVLDITLLKFHDFLIGKGAKEIRNFQGHGAFADFTKTHKFNLFSFLKQLVLKGVINERAFCTFGGGCAAYVKAGVEKDVSLKVPVSGGGDWEYEELTEDPILDDFEIAGSFSISAEEPEDSEFDEIIKNRLKASAPTRHNSVDQESIVIDLSDDSDIPPSPKKFRHSSSQGKDLGTALRNLNDLLPSTHQLSDEAIRSIVNGLPCSLSDLRNYQGLNEFQIETFGGLIVNEINNWLNN
jgi:RecQ family ATP-dependent DNA helicase